MLLCLCLQLNLSNNQLCGVYAGRRGLVGTYDAGGITALSEALKVTASLMRLEVKDNLLGEEGEAALRKATEGRSGFELLL